MKKKLFKPNLIDTVFNFYRCCKNGSQKKSYWSGRAGSQFVIILVPKPFFFKFYTDLILRQSIEHGLIWCCILYWYIWKFGLGWNLWNLLKTKKVKLLLLSTLICKETCMSRLLKHFKTNFIIWYNLEKSSAMRCTSV